MIEPEFERPMTIVLNISRLNSSHHLLFLCALRFFPSFVKKRKKASIINHFNYWWWDEF